MELLRNVPIGQYVAGKSGWLRSLDPRLKFAWVLMFLVSPVLAGPLWRVALALALLLITVFRSLPLRIIWRPFSLLIIFSILCGLLATFLPTNETPSVLTVRSPQELPNLLLAGSHWEIIKIGTFVIDRRSAELGLKTSTLIFTVVHSVNLMLCTTSPEDLMWTLRWYLKPIALLGFPLDRMSFQLLLALRFIPLVQEEFQNLIRSIINRAINFKELGLKKSVGLILSVGERLLSNILLRAEQGAESLLIRNHGMILHPSSLKPKGLIKRSNAWLNSIAIAVLFITIILRKEYGAL